MLLLGMVTNTIWAQYNIVVQDISRPNDLYTNSGDSALILVRSHESIELEFFLSKDKNPSKFQSFRPSRTELDFSEDSIYYFVFPTGNKYPNQRLTISAIGGNSVSIDIDLGPKEVKTYRVSRPFGFIVERCYPKHRNKAREEIEKGNYDEALAELRLAKDCADKDSIEHAELIATVNNCMIHRRDGDEAFEKHEYKVASGHYKILFLLNASDTLSEKRYNECQNYLLYKCDTLYNKALQSYESKDYLNARFLLREVISQADQLDNDIIKIKYVSDATERIGKATSKYERKVSIEERRSRFKHSLTYEYRKDTPIGISYSSFQEHETGGFFQLDLNSMIFKEIQSKCKYGDTKFAEVNTAFGWTMKLFKYAWFHIGPGLTFKFYHGTYKNSNCPKIGYGESELLDSYYMGDDVSLPKDEIPEKYEDGWKQRNLAIAVSPVVGFDLKLQFVVLRLTYQYRIATQSKLGDFIERHRLSFGAGVAF